MNSTMNRTQSDITFASSKGINTLSVKRQGPIGMHCDAPKSVSDPFPSVMASGTLHIMDPMGSNLTLDARFVYSLNQPYLMFTNIGNAESVSTCGGVNTPLDSLSLVAIAINCH